VETMRRLRGAHVVHARRERRQMMHHARKTYLNGNTPITSLPRPVLQQLGVQPGDTIVFRQTDTGVELTTVPRLDTSDLEDLEL